MTPRILFIDDEAPVRESLTLFFRKKSIEVVTATNGAEAKELLKGSQRFDLAIVDLYLARENGLSLFGMLQACHPTLPIMVLTALGADESLVAQAQAAGARCLISKTESLHDLFAAVSRYLHLSPLSSSLPRNDLTKSPRFGSN